MSQEVSDEATPLWGGTVDNETYTVMVVQDPENALLATLTVTYDKPETPEVLLNEQVSVMFGAIFGPDTSDVLLWQAKALDVIDAHYLQRGATPPPENPEG